MATGICKVARLDRDSALANTLGAACRGEGVGAAPAASGKRRLVVLDDRGHQVDWTTAEASWRADDVAEADLVACVDRHSDAIETCRYRPIGGGPTQSFDRYRETVTARIVESRSATELGRIELSDDARACRNVEQEGQGDLHGHVNVAAFSTELAPYLAR